MNFAPVRLTGYRDDCHFATGDGHWCRWCGQGVYSAAGRCRRCNDPIDWKGRRSSAYGVGHDDRVMRPDGVVHRRVMDVAEACGHHIAETRAAEHHAREHRVMVVAGHAFNAACCAVARWFWTAGREGRVLPLTRATVSEAATLCAEAMRDVLRAANVGAGGVEVRIRYGHRGALIDLTFPDPFGTRSIELGEYEDDPRSWYHVAHSSAWAGV